MNFVPNSIIVNSIILENFKGEMLEISDLLRELNIYESIYQNTMAGTIELVDSVDMIQFFPIIGEEKIHLDLQMPGEDESRSLTLSFNVYRISDRVIRSDKIQNYTLWFSSPELLLSLEQKVSRSWQNVTVSKIVEDIVKNYFKTKKKVYIETTNGILNYIAPAQNPLKVINYLASTRAINKENLADYAFFENLTAKGSAFNFVSLGSLATQDTIATLSYHPVNKSNKNGIKIYPLNIDNIEFKKTIDTMESKAAGLYNQTYLMYDHLRKKYVVAKTNHEEIFKTIKKSYVDGDSSNPTYSKLNKKPLEFYKVLYVDEFPSTVSNPELNNTVNKLSESQPKRNNLDYISKAGTPDELNAGSLKEKVAARRKVLLQDYENNKIYIRDISGNLGYTVGRMINLDLPHIMHNRDVAIEKFGQNENMHISGKYLITKCRHRITKHKTLNYEYKCYLEIAKNSFKEKISKQ